VRGSIRTKVAGKVWELRHAPASPFEHGCLFARAPCRPRMRDVTNGGMVNYPNVDADLRARVGSTIQASYLPTTMPV
jgi:hypothetical protein